MSQSSRTVPETCPPASFFALLVLCFSLDVSIAQSTIEQWGMFEVALKGQTNPYLDVRFSARFYKDETSVEVNGFYDGDGTYRVRFMPETQGRWRYVTRSSALELDGKSGEFTVTAPSPGNHGPVRATNTFHFAYADGKAYILFHPYDNGHWGYDRMSPVADDRYLRYLVSRLAALRNVWWALANEYDFMTKKREEDWERFGQIVSANDSYHHLLSIHNGRRLFNHTRSWITHASIQNGSAVEDAGRAVLLRDAYRKPIVYDEVKYEGDIPKRWGNISAEEMVHRFWQGTIAGSYVGHGETYLHPSDVLWWSKGGVLRGQSPARLAFLRQVLEESPASGIEPIDKWQNPEYGGQAPDYYLVYLGKQTPTLWEFNLPRPPQASGKLLEEGMQFQTEVLDAWNMTVTPVEGRFTLKKKTDYFFGDKDGRAIPLPGKPYIAIRIKRVR
jgi:hypothetical protein